MTITKRATKGHTTSALSISRIVVPKCRAAFPALSPATLLLVNAVSFNLDAGNFTGYATQYNQELRQFGCIPGSTAAPGCAACELEHGTASVRQIAKSNS